MKDQIQRTLQSLLRVTGNLPPQQKLEEMTAAAKTRLVNYQNEGNAYGVATYAPIVAKLEQAKSVEDAFNSLKQDYGLS
jgi:hypothetical protein